jgi:hypothetical protein
VDPKAGLDDVEKRTFLTPLGLELRPLGHPVAIPTALSIFILNWCLIIRKSTNRAEDYLVRSFNANYTYVFSCQALFIQTTMQDLHPRSYTRKRVTRQL